jgi:pyridoxamine 5'-phosphate oxidase
LGGDVFHTGIRKWLESSICETAVYRFRFTEIELNELDPLIQGQCTQSELARFTSQVEGRLKDFARRQKTVELRAGVTDSKRGLLKLYGPLNEMSMLPDHSEIMDDPLATRLWQELTRATHDRHHEWRTPILATQGLDHSGPQARTVVLRQAEASMWTLRVYTDARSPKCAELVAQPLAQLTFWSKRLNWQLRVSALATIDFEGEPIDAAWARIRQSHAAADYLSALPPGHTLPAHEQVGSPSAGAPREHHLAILNFKVMAMDWLALHKDGHRRARLTPDGTVQPLVP